MSESTPEGGPQQAPSAAAQAETPTGQAETPTVAEFDPTDEQAVGRAVGANPISVLVPCHRVVGADGSITGYAGGLDRKRTLLALEEPPARERDALF